jgi:hypothetical protein
MNPRVDTMVEIASLGALGTVKGLALTLAVIHHGLSCFAHDAIPASTRTVLLTAETFEQHIIGRQ